MGCEVCVNVLPFLKIPFNEVYIEKLQTPLGNSQTESNLLLLKENRIGGSKPWNIPYDNYEYRGQLLSTASVTLYREVLDVNYYLDV